MQNQDNLGNLFHEEIQGHKFNFQPFTIGTLTGYHVDVSDQEGSRHEFRMERKDDEEWTIEGENLPAWITDLHNEIIGAVNNHG